MGPNVQLTIALSPAAQQLLLQKKLGQLSQDTLLALEFRGQGYSRLFWVREALRQCAHVYRCRSLKSPSLDGVATQVPPPATSSMSCWDVVQPKPSNGIP